MTVQYTDVQGVDFVLPAAPPLTDPPLSLIQEAIPLIDLTGQTAARQTLVERLASAAEQLEAYDRGGVVGDQDQPGDADAIEDARKALIQQMSEWADELGVLDDAIKELQRWELGFLYLPELTNDSDSMAVVAPYDDPAIANPTVTATKPDADNQRPFLWYDPFVAVALDRRSAFGWPHSDYAERAQRSRRGLMAHEDFQCEQEYWTGLKIPTNYHLSASPNTPTTSSKRTLTTAFPNPTAPLGTVLGTAVPLGKSLAALDSALARADGGTGIIHCTPYVLQMWMKVFNYLRDGRGLVRTVNNNPILPGYGYPGTGPDQASRSVSDGVTNSGSATVTSATAAFTNFDIGMPIEGAGIPAGSVIVTVTSATDVDISAEATASATGVDLTLPGRGGDATGSRYQWAYATDAVYHCGGDIKDYPVDLREMAPALVVDDDVPVRSERSHAFISNQLVRAAVLVDTETT